MNYSPHNSCALYVNNPESICYKSECRSSRQCERTKPDPKDARIAELEEALRWALAEIEGRTRYDTQGQQDNAHDLARAALTAMEQTNG